MYPHLTVYLGLKLQTGAETDLNPGKTDLRNPPTIRFLESVSAW